MAKSKYYIIDTTLSRTPVYYSTVKEVVKHLEGTVQRHFKLSRQQYMQNYAELGYGDDCDITFVSALSEFFNIGVVGKDGSLVKSNICDAERNARYRTECGN